MKTIFENVFHLLEIHLYNIMVPVSGSRVIFRPSWTQLLFLRTRILGKWQHRLAIIRLSGGITGNHE